MKLLHLADLHIGKRVHEFSMLEEQKHVLSQILEYGKQYKPDAVLIAGDVYDRSVPAADAVLLFDEFLVGLHQLNIKVFLISGNHDSAERLQFAGSILEESGVYVAGSYDGTLKHVTLQDEYGEVVIWLMPFVRPAAVTCFHVIERCFVRMCKRAYGKKIGKAPVLRVKVYKWNFCARPDKMKQKETFAQTVPLILKHNFYKKTNKNQRLKGDKTVPFLKGEEHLVGDRTRHVLVAHQFVTYNGEAEQCESEYHNIGGLDEIDVAIFQDFDYVALGHLHGAQKIGRETVRYAGSPLKYSFSEVYQKKSVTLVELKEKGTVDIKLLPLTPIHDMRKIKGPLAALVSKEVVEAAPADDYMHVTLTDEEELYDAVGQLRAKYPNLMRLEFENSRTKALQKLDGMTAQWKNASPVQLFAEFYEQQNGVCMSDEEEALLRQFLNAEQAIPIFKCVEH